MRQLSELRSRVAELRRHLFELEAQQKLFGTRLADLGIDKLEDAETFLTDRANRLAKQIDYLSAVTNRGEKLTLAIVRLSEERQRAELSAQRTDFQQRVTLLQTQLDAQDKTYALAGKIIDGLRRASLEVTARQVESLCPLLQLIYSRIDAPPHV